MKIVTAGLYRTGTTWQYNAIRFIMEEAHGKENIYSCFIGNYEPSNKKVEIIKTHVSNPRITGNPDYLITTRRPIKDVEASMLRRLEYIKKHPTTEFRNEANVDNIHKLANHTRYFLNKADYIQEFELIKNNPEKIIKDLCCLFKVDIDITLIIDKLNSMVVPTTGYDKETLLHEGHITKP